MDNRDGQKNSATIYSIWEEIARSKVISNMNDWSIWAKLGPKWKGPAIDNEIIILASEALED